MWYIILYNILVTSLSINKHLYGTKVILRSRKLNFLLLWTFNTDIIKFWIPYTQHREKLIQFIDENSLLSIIFNAFFIDKPSHLCIFLEIYYVFYSLSRCSSRVQLPQQPNKKPIYFSPYTQHAFRFLHDTAPHKFCYTRKANFHFSENCFININREFNNIHIYEENDSVLCWNASNIIFN